MKTADREAVKVVKRATATTFGQHVMYVQHRPEYKVAWRTAWRSVRLLCPECESGYLRKKERGAAGTVDCVECAWQFRGKFWHEKAKIVLHLVVGEDGTDLWPYILVEIRDRVPA